MNTRPLCDAYDAYATFSTNLRRYSVCTHVGTALVLSVCMCCQRTCGVRIHFGVALWHVAQIPGEPRRNAAMARPPPLLLPCGEAGLLGCGTATQRNRSWPLDTGRHCRAARALLTRDRSATSTDSWITAEQRWSKTSGFCTAKSVNRTCGTERGHEAPTARDPTY